MARTKPPRKPTKASAGLLAPHANEPTATNTANKVAVRITTSSMVTRPVRSEDAAGAA